jgi:hypothetical protein
LVSKTAKAVLLRVWRNKSNVGWGELANPNKDNQLPENVGVHASPHATNLLNQAEKDDPQPQVFVALGLRITNCEPDKSSL